MEYSKMASLSDVQTHYERKRLMLPHSYRGRGYQCFGKYAHRTMRREQDKGRRYYEKQPHLLEV